jgi:ankyrin repeat protein
MSRPVIPRSLRNPKLRRALVIVTLIAVPLLLLAWHDVASARQQEADEELIWAAKLGRAADLKTWLSRGANPNAIDHNEPRYDSSWDWMTAHLRQLFHPASSHTDEPTVLAAAAGSKHSLEMVRELVDRGATVSAAPGENSPLSSAVVHGDTETVFYLLEHGARIREAPEGLFSAARGGDMKTTMYFVEHGADVNHFDYSLTPLMGAVLSQKPELVKYLLSKGADASPICDMGDTALSMAAGNKEIVALLKRAGATK